MKNLLGVVIFFTLFIFPFRTYAAFTVTDLTSGVTTNTTGTSFNTASVTIHANKIVFLASYTRGGGTNLTSITSTGATWVQVGSTLSFSAPPTVSTHTMTLWRTMVSSDKTGTIAMGYGVGAPSLTWDVFEIDGVDTSGTNGSGAVVQTVGTFGASVMLTSTLAAFGSVNNGTLGVGGAGSALTNEAGYTAIGSINDASTNFLRTEFLPSNDTTPIMTKTASTGWGFYGVEIKAAAAAAPAVTPPSIFRVQGNRFRIWGGLFRVQ